MRAFWALASGRIPELSSGLPGELSELFSEASGSLPELPGELLSGASERLPQLSGGFQSSPESSL